MRDETSLDLQSYPHRRRNPLTGDWVLVSPHRTQRPWQGQVETTAVETSPHHDPGCYLCPGNARSGGILNPAYQGTFVFDNDFPALRPGVPAAESTADELFEARTEQGICRVICYSPRHDLTLAGMRAVEIRGVVDTWAEQTRELGSRPDIASVQIFENRGAMMGASNPHPHGQVWANASVPNELRRELSRQHDYHARRRSCLLCDYLAAELSRGERLVCANEHFAAVVPFWAVWPFETLLIGRRHTRDLAELDDEERSGLADVLGRLTAGYDALFGVPFPYTMGWHQRPTDGADHAPHHLHAHFYPPLLRSATVRKFMVGYELLGMPQRDITPESAAARLREARPQR